MEIVDVSKASVTGLPLYEMRELFQIKNFNSAKISLVTILPGARVPAEGTGSHTGDEYSYFVEGEVYTESGSQKATIGKGLATLIPMGEEHWCENRTKKPCTLICVMVEP